MNLNHLRVFAAVAEESSITGAAGRLRISQPAVSKQLAEFEQALGTRLADRLPRGIRLTQAGKLLEGHARRIFQREVQAEQDLAHLLGLASGRLSIGASTTIGSYLVPGLFARFRERHSEVRLELEIGNTAAIQTAVREDRLDLGLTEGFAEGEGLEVEEVAHDDIVMIASPDDELVRRAPIPVAELERIPLIMREHGSGTRDVIEAALERRGLRITPVVSLGSTEAVKSGVMQGLGAALVSRLTVELELRAGVLALIEIADLAIHRALHLLTLEGKSPSPAAAAFIQLLRANLE